MKFFMLLLLMSSHAFAEAPTEQRQQELRNLLKHDCGACHGLNLKGGLGPSLLPADLADKTDAFLIETLLKGRKGTPMPPWSRFLNRDEAAWLVDLLKHP